MAHTHEYVQHPKWAGHYVCRVCGFAAPKAVVDRVAPAAIVTGDNEVCGGCGAHFDTEEHAAGCINDRAD